MNPRLAQALRSLSEGKPDAARQTLTRALTSAPSDPDLCNAMMLTLLRLGQPEQALHFAQRASTARPTDPTLHLNVGNCLGLLGRADDSEAPIRRALQLAPDLPAARQALATLLCTRGDHAAAAPLIEGLPDSPSLAAMRTTLLLQLGRAPEAVRCGAQAVADFPNDRRPANALAVALNYDPAAPDARAAHESFGRCLAPCSSAPPPQPPADPDRRLRLGILSAEFRRHSVADFLLPALAHLPRDRFELILYYTSTASDATTDRFRAAAGAWRDAAALSDAALNERIRSDRIDILIETSGLTNGHRLAALVPRAAPIQISYLGYPNTTGLPTMDWRLIDANTEPGDSPGPEHLARLAPSFLCWAPPDDAPPVELAGPRRPPTFGCFAAMPKLNEQLLSLWSRLLQASPGSRLTIKSHGLRDESSRAAFLARFPEPDRITLLPPTATRRDHLAAYTEIDLALDTFPYAGTTSTLESLWMGVPVITRAGSAHPGRTGLSILSTLGCPELIASTEAEYLRLAAELAADPARLRTYRATLRDRLRASPLCDAPTFGQHLGLTLRQLWTQWCSQEPRR